MIWPAVNFFLSHNNIMHHWSPFILFMILSVFSYAEVKDRLPIDSFYDEKVDYSVFTGRVTDRDRSTNILKISSESKNIKFFRAGDVVKFRLAIKETDMCTGFVRNVENQYFVVHVKSLYPCWGEEEYFRRGTVLYFDSNKLAERVRQASLYRLVLINRRRDFLKQLNGVNNFLWTFDQQKVKELAKIDEKIVKLKQLRQKSLEKLFVKKADQLNLQKELIFRMDELDRDLKFYRIEKDELFFDRWHLDQDLGLPVSKRPQKPIYR